VSTTPATIKLAFFNVLKTDSAGSAVRAALGNLGESVITRDDLDSSNLPAAPFLVMQWGAEGGARTGVRSFFPTWWAYDTKRYFRINALLPLIEAAYPEGAIAYCYTDFLNKTGEIKDANLGYLPCRGFPFQIKTRG